MSTLKIFWTSCVIFIFAVCYQFCLPDRMEKQYSIKHFDNMCSRNTVFESYLYFIVKQTREELDKEVN